LDATPGSSARVSVRFAPMRALLVPALALLALPSGALAATPADGASCLTPAAWTLPKAQAKRITGGGQRLAHKAAGGPTVRLRGGSTMGGFSLRATVSAKQWRVCGLRGKGWSVPGPVKTRVAARVFAAPVNRLVVEIARRTSSDGDSCANPLVVVSDSAEGAGDTIAGRIQLTDDEGAVAQSDPRGTVTRTAQWQSAIGYRTCYAAGLGAAGFGASDPFVDRRPGDSLSHVLDTFTCCPNHPPEVQYLYAAYARAPQTGRR
jgi:hypothetical protein